MTHASLQKTARRVAALAALLVLAFAASGCNKLKARDLLNKGVTAFKNGQSDAAIEYFKQAKEADPDLLNARLYLATAYASLYIPGAPSQENMARGNQAIAEFKEVLEKDPNNISAIDGIGVIDWTLAFRGNGEMRMDYNKNNIRKQVKDTDPLPGAIRTEYASKYGQLIDEGITDLQKAISIKPDYDDAMAYLNLLYRRKADMVESKEEREALLKQADDLVDKVKEIKQKRSEQPQPS